MILRFPNARLFIHTLLSDRSMTGAEAITLGAYEYHLFPHGSVDISEIAYSDQHCRCQSTAKEILREYIERQGHGEQKAKENVKHSCNLLSVRIERWASMCNLKLPERECSKDCSLLAPALFDFILQEITHYS